MNTLFEISRIKNIAKINYILLATYLSISITCHAIANRLIAIDNVPIISAGLIYMSVFVLTDVFASFNSRRFVIFIIFLEALANLFFIFYTSFINHMPFPKFFHNRYAYEVVFNPVLMLYIANLCGTLISAIIDLFIFYYLFWRRKWIFIAASFCSSIVTISCYTFITDYVGFKNSYPAHVLELTYINLITNFITLLFYTILGQFLVMLIQTYLNKPVKTA